jgi:hypothetical protein
MKKLMITMLILLGMMALVACSPGGQTPAASDEPAATGEVLEPTATEESAAATAEPSTPAGCPAATDATYLLRDPRHGFCLLYPVGHKIERPNPDEVTIVVGSLLNVTDPRVGITVTAADGQTAQDLAEEIIAGFEGFEIAQSETMVAGEPAIVLDDVPGQDINRQVLFTHDGRLYHLYFSPVDPANTGPIEDFAETILGSFTFIPVSETVTAGDECVAPKADQQAIVSEQFGYCLVVPADFTYEEPSETNANLFVGSMMDVEHPKLLIEVTDAGDLTATEAADELAASFEGVEIPRTFGDTLGYEPADRLDGVPGQDLGRVLLAVHNDRLYRLTFVPNDPSQGEVYNEMETLFAQVLSTFRFLP